MKLLAKIVAPMIVVFALLPFGAHAQEAPDVLVKRISEEVVNAAKSDKQIQGGNQQRVLALVEEKIIPGSWPLLASSHAATTTATDQGVP
jgi:phospholipid transport system substrate-binding protein